MKHLALRGFGVLIIVAWLAACGRSDDVLATFDRGSITAADFDQYLLSLPESRREIAKDQTAEEWARFNLEQLAVRRILTDSECARGIAASPEIQAFRTWTRSGLLAQKLIAQIGQGWQPDPDLLAAEIQEMQRRADIRTLYTFRHIYFRTDRASSPSEIEETRRRARRVADLARSGADFVTLIQQHSDSEDANRGGLVGNVPPSALDDATRGVLASMSEGDVSPVIETRTGLHIFRLERAIVTEPMAEERIVSTAQNALRRRQLKQQQTDLTEVLRNRIAVEASDSGWTVGSWEVDNSVLGWVRSSGDVATDALESRVVDQFLLAQEAVDRGLDTTEIAAEVDRIVSSTVLDRCLADVRRELVSEITEDQLRELYDAQPSQFADSEKARVELIFIPQGSDGFTTQLMAEDLVAELRSGGSFADAAREHSTGPGRDQGGDLGLLGLREWGAFGPSVFKALRELEVGTVSDPVYCTDKVLGSASLLTGGFAILRIAERIPESPRPFEDAIEDVRRAWAMKNRELVSTQVRERVLREGGFEIVRLPGPDDLQS